MTKVLMTMGLPSDRSHEQSVNIEFANSIRCYSHPYVGPLGGLAAVLGLQASTASYPAGRL